MKIFVPICLLILFLPVISMAQSASPPLRLGMGFSGYSYLGDLVEQAPRVVRGYPGASLSVQFDGQKRIQMQVNGGFGRFTEQNDLVRTHAVTEVIPNDFVQTSFFYTDLRLRLRFLRRSAIQPYVSAGAGLLFFNPRDAAGNFLGENIFTRKDNENYSTIVAGFPTTVGVEARMSKQLGLSLEYTYRFTSSDYLDNIGELGTKKGNDAIQSLQLSVLISLAPLPVAPLPQKTPEQEAPPVLALTPIKISHSTPELFILPNHLEKIDPPQPEAYEQLQNFIRTDLIIIIDSLQVLPIKPAIDHSVGVNQK